MTQGGKRRRIRIYEVTRVNHDVALRPVAKIHSFVGKIVTCNSPEVNSKVLNRAKATSPFSRARTLHLCLQQLLVFDASVATKNVKSTALGDPFSRDVKSIFDARECTNLSRIRINTPIHFHRSIRTCRENASSR